MNGYILNLVTYFDNRDFTKHYDAKVRLQGDQPQQKQDGYALFCQREDSTGISSVAVFF